MINCARPHWSEYSAEEISRQEWAFIDQLELFAKETALKINTSGVWLFGKATESDLKTFSPQPFDIVKSDVDTIEKVLQLNWNIVYSPSLVYGENNCQLQRIIEPLDEKTFTVAIPSTGYNQYIHLNDITQYYLNAVQTRTMNQQSFIAEPVGYILSTLHNFCIKTESKKRWTEWAGLILYR